VASHLHGKNGRLAGRSGHRRKSAPFKLPSSNILESGNLAQIKANKNYSDDLCRFYWNLYAELSSQRKVVEQELLESLGNAAIEDFPIDHWQRVVKFTYSHTPFSTVGSLKFGGGRFNIGDVDTTRFPPFPAFYLAEDKETAFTESLGQDSPEGLNAFDFALTKPDSVACLSISGHLDSVLDITANGSLGEFVKLISKFRISPQLQREANRLKLGQQTIVRTEQLLLAGLNDIKWRAFPQVVDVPANSQIFGQLVRSAQVCGILYVSKFTDKKCLAIYPRNFDNTGSYIALDDRVPDPIILTRIDSSNWMEAEATL
jgi:RES domain-containing protein